MSGDNRRARFVRGNEAFEAAERTARADAWREVMRRITDRKRTDHEAAKAWRGERLAHGGSWHHEPPSLEQLQLLSSLLNLPRSALSARGLTKLSACLATEMAYQQKPGGRTREAENILLFARRSAKEVAQRVAPDA